MGNCIKNDTMWCSKWEGILTLIRFVAGFQQCDKVKLWTSAGGWMLVEDKSPTPLSVGRPANKQLSADAIISAFIFTWKANTQVQPITQILGLLLMRKWKGNFWIFKKFSFSKKRKKNFFICPPVTTHSRATLSLRKHSCGLSSCLYTEVLKDLRASQGPGGADSSPVALAACHTPCALGLPFRISWALLAFWSLLLPVSGWRWPSAEPPMSSAVLQREVFGGSPSVWWLLALLFMDHCFQKVRQV